MKKYLHIIVPAIAIILCSLFNFTSNDKKINDFFIRALKPLKENNDVVLVNIDDAAVEYVGTFPWTRDVMADGIVYMREMGAKSVIFDLSYLDKSPQKVDPDYVKNELPQYIDYGFSRLNESMNSVIDSFGNGSLVQSDTEYVKDEIHYISDEVKNEINTSISYVTKDMDEYLSQCLKFFGNSYLTLTFTQGNKEIPVTEKEYLSSVVALKNISGDNDSITPVYNSVEPAIELLLRNAKSAGFVNADPDKDGYLRRIDLLVKYDNQYYGQLVFVPLLEKLGNPQIVVTNSLIILKNAKISETETRDIKIPRGEDGKVIIKYPKKQYENYNVISMKNIYRSKRMEKQLINNLSTMQENGFFNVWLEDETPLDLYQAAQYLKEELYSGENVDEGITFDSYKEYRNNFFNSLNSFLNDGYQEQLITQVDDEETINYINDFFNECSIQYNDLITNRENVKNLVQNSTCIVGTTATSTTDFGLTMNEEHYPNVGVHYVLSNMLMNQDFIDDSPWWISILFAIIICYTYCFIAKKLSTVKQLFLGIGILVISTGVLLLIFVITKKYIGVIVPFSSMAVTFVGMTVLGFLTTAKEKTFLRSAFSRYLSSEVINEIIKDPKKLNLGGESREMTALFTDIQSFSTLSEKLTPVQLVNLLNHYLTNMSDIILERKGTIDKFEGDAIIAFFGAPIHLKNHAELACYAAIGIKKAEEELNKEILAKGESPTPLFTRIGINTGEMVVGNMGTQNKMNYTMMGNSVNLAARLEGVNKQYNTRGILISEHTRKQIGNRFIIRSLDRVRVVGVNTPLRLYELLDEARLADGQLVVYVTKWEQAIKLYEDKKFNEALEAFNALSTQDKQDNVVKLYIERTKGFINNPPPEDWDGVFNLTQK